MSVVVKLPELVETYVKHHDMGNVRSFEFSNTYNKKTSTVTIEFLDDDYLRELIERLDTGLAPDVDERYIIADLLRTHPLYVERSIKPEETIEERFDSLTYGDLQSPAADRIKEEIDRRNNTMPSPILPIPEEDPL